MLRRLAVLSLFCLPLSAATAEPYPDHPVGTLEVVATFEGPMPTGVTVSHHGRIFVNFPRWEDRPSYTVGELKDGKVVPYPDVAFNHDDPNHAGDCLISVQSVVVDPKDRLWILDTGNYQFGRNFKDGPKLVGIDLATNKIFKKILLPDTVALPTSYLNDVRFDLRRGSEGIAFITDCETSGHAGLIMVDLASGHSWRHLTGHASVEADRTMIPIINGSPVVLRPKDAAPMHLNTGADSLAISPDGKKLIYSPLISRRLYTVSTDLLADEHASEAAVAATVVDLGDKGGGSDGLEADTEGHIYCTNYEQNCVTRRSPDGSFEVLVHDARLQWPDTMSLATDGYLYITANQLHLQDFFHRGQDQRKKPYYLFRTKVNASPVLLK